MIDRSLALKRTLIIPLIARAIYSSDLLHTFKDIHAEELVKSGGYDCRQFVQQTGESILCCYARTLQFDRVINQFLSCFDGIIVDLGCGLDTGFYRHDNSKIKWINIDKPDVIAFRKKYFHDSFRQKDLEYDLRDECWAEEVQAITNGSQKILFIASGVFHYLNKNDVKSLIKYISEKFPESILIFDYIPESAIPIGNQILKQANISDPALDQNEEIMKFGIDNPHEFMLDFYKEYKIMTTSSNSGLFEGFLYDESIHIETRLKMFAISNYNKSGIIHIVFL